MIDYIHALGKKKTIIKTRINIQRHILQDSIYAFALCTSSRALKTWNSFRHVLQWKVWIKNEKSVEGTTRLDLQNMGLRKKMRERKKKQKRNQESEKERKKARKKERKWEKKRESKQERMNLQ